MRKESIEIVQKDNGVFVSKFAGELGDKEGNGVTIEESVKDLFFQISLSEAKNENERVKLFIEEKRPEALKIAKEVFNLMGVDYFEVIDYVNKSKQSKEEVKLKLNFLGNFGLLQADRRKGAGQRWKVVLETDDLINHYEAEASKYEATMKYYVALKDQLLELKRKENEDKTAEETPEGVQANSDN